jgi:spermidine synthase
VSRSVAGSHLLVELVGCRQQLLADEAYIREALVGAARATGVAVQETSFHRLESGGVIGLVAVKKWQLTIHTWPERRCAAVDVFLWGKSNARRALDHLVSELNPENVHVTGRKEGGRLGATNKGRGADRAPRPGRSRRAREPQPESESFALLYGLTLTVAACSLTYELLLAQTLSALLGDTVLRYSITIGVYLGALGVGALLCEARPRDPTQRLMRVELGLSALGGICVPLFYFFDMAQRYFHSYSEGLLVGTLWGPIGFLVATHLVIIAIGLLSGFEVPLLLAMGEKRRPGSTNRLLGVDYLGALAGAVAFPLLLVRHLGLVASAFSVALLNAFACILVMAIARERRSWSGLAAAIGLVVFLGSGLAYADEIEQYFLQKFYYALEQDHSNLWAMIDPRNRVPEVRRIRSPYQTVDIYYKDDEDQSYYALISTKQERDPEYPVNVRLYLNRRYQFHSATDEIYHEWFVHAPIQAVGRAPRNALVLGAGDGLVVRELRRYPRLERVVLVELDPVMLELARSDPVMTRMNDSALEDPRVEVIRDDAFHWLRTTEERFDAIYVDMPYPRDYNLAQVYSREFYALAARHVRKNGFLVLDAPDGNCELEEGLWAIYYNTLRAVGFPSIHSMITRFDLSDPDIQTRIRERAIQTRESWTTGEAPDRETTVEGIHASVEEDLRYLVAWLQQDFILVFPEDRAPRTEWRDFGLRHYAFSRSHFSLAFRQNCPTRVDERLVNSIFRPTLPPLRVANVETP